MRGVAWIVAGMVLAAMAASAGARPLELPGPGASPHHTSSCGPNLAPLVTSCSMAHGGGATPPMFGYNVMGLFAGTIEMSIKAADGSPEAVGTCTGILVGLLILPPVSLKEECALSGEVPIAEPFVYTCNTYHLPELPVLGGQPGGVGVWGCFASEGAPAPGP